ncbi:hypothetical protein BgAZ_402030 [Babesia gibsoni]|uniref:Uncharacterized protein n=1 Tax=Babesia gibsoni TaxID=33632 RepID=A0AAD8PCM4_BABGI|nr:hypothetical protein BgAZ_402030 [Babesia gibsoni]
MKNIVVAVFYMMLASIWVTSAAYTSELALCADICPYSTLVAENGVGMNRCYEACKRLIHRVKFGDVMDSTNGRVKVEAPRPSIFKRLKGGLGKTYKQNLSKGKTSSDTYPKEVSSDQTPPTTN